MSNAIEVTNMTFSYGDIPILEAVNWIVNVGEFIGLVGPNGGGKTTLLNLIVGLLVPDDGEIKVFDQPPVKVRKSIGYVPQFADVDRSFPITVMDVVLMGRLGLTGFLGQYRRIDRELARQAMEQVGVGELRQRRLGSLSEGQKQRVLIARALATRPRLLILDEPTASVDSLAGQAISKLLEELRKSITIVMVSHDLELLSSHADRLFHVNQKLVPFQGQLVPFDGKPLPSRR